MGVCSTTLLQGVANTPIGMLGFVTIGPEVVVDVAHEEGDVEISQTDTWNYWSLRGGIDWLYDFTPETTGPRVGLVFEVAGLRTFNPSSLEPEFGAELLWGLRISY